MQKGNILVSYDTSENVFVMDNIHGNTNYCFYHNRELILWLFSKHFWEIAFQFHMWKQMHFLSPRKDYIVNTIYFEINIYC